MSQSADAPQPDAESPPTNAPTTDAPTATDAPKPDPKKLSPLDEIKRDAQAAIDESHSSGAIRAKVVQTLVDTEVDRRSQLLLAAYQKARETQAALARLKPDTKYHIVAGETVEAYSDAQHKERTKLESQLAKQTAAISKAIEHADYACLEKLAG